MGFLSAAKGYVILAVLLIMSGMAATIWFQKREIRSLNRAVATEQANVKIEKANAEVAKKAAIEANDETKKLLARRGEDQRELGAVQEALKRVAVERDDNRARLDSWRSRLETETLKRPEVVEQAACGHRFAWVAQLCAPRRERQHAHEAGGHYTVRRADA